MSRAMTLSPSCSPSLPSFGKDTRIFFLNVAHQFQTRRPTSNYIFRKRTEYYLLHENKCRPVRLLLLGLPAYEARTNDRHGAVGLFHGRFCPATLSVGCLRLTCT